MNSTKGKVITCSAAVLWKEGTALAIETITVDPPLRGEVRVRMVAAGVCASDAHFVWGQSTDLQLDFGGVPVVLGHEGAAVVESVGAGVEGVAEGDHVIPLFIPNCDDCALCRNPRTNRCADADFVSLLRPREGDTRLKVGGKPLLSFCGTNCFAEYAVLRQSQICKVDKAVDLKNACILGCAVGTGFGSVRHLAEVHRDSTCAVWGLGAIGLSTAKACALAGARRVVGIDVNKEKERFGRAFGCTHFLAPDEAESQLAGAVDYAFDCVGNNAVLRSGLRCLSPWGALVCVGLGPVATLEVRVGDILGGQRLIGGYFANQKSRRAVQELCEEFMEGLAVEALITHRFELKDINKAFDLLKAGESVRSVIEFR